MGTGITERPGDPRPKWQVAFGNSRYVAKMAETGAELEQALRLRHAVYYEELLQAPLPSGIDADRFDPLWDHLIIQTRDTCEVIATYRLNASHTADYYSQQEFELEAFLRLPGRKLEIGRVCVARRHRSREVFVMLIRGLTAYLLQAEARYMFGCSSLHIETSGELAALCRHFRLHHFSSDAPPVRPLPSGAVPDSRLRPTGPAMNESDAQRLIPPLLQFYLSCGARVCGEPYYDPEFKTYDFFTLLDIATATPVYQRFIAGTRAALEKKRAFGGTQHGPDRPASSSVFR